MEHLNRLDVKRIRRSLGLTQDQLAKKLGVGLVTVGRWESDESRGCHRRCTGSAMILLLQLEQERNKLNRRKRSAKDSTAISSTH